MEDVIKQHSNAIKYPLKYSESAVILYLLSMEITNLSKEIRDKSPVESKYLHVDSLFTPGQISEARKHFTGFIKQAIAVVAKRQIALNLLAAQKQHMKILIAEVEDGIAIALQNPTYISEDRFKRIEKMLNVLKKKNMEILAIEATLRKNAKIVNELLDKHSSEWKQHHVQYVAQLIAELESKGVLLSELEQNDLRTSIKTIDEVRQNLKRQSLIKE